MKKGIISVAFIILYITLITSTAYASENTKIIHTYNQDVTGDGIMETILLKGDLFSPEGKYYRNIWAVVTLRDNKTKKINFGGGYMPSLDFIDLNHDSTKDIFYQSARGGSGGFHKYVLYTFKNEKLSKLPLPQPNNIKGKFINNFIAVLYLAPMEKPMLIPVKRNIDDYIRLGIYNQDGKLLKQTPLIITPPTLLKPFFISEANGYGLKAYQKVSGAYMADILGNIETLWYFDKGKWLKMQTNWQQKK